MIDVNVYLSRWPFRRLVADDPPVLVSELRKRQVTQAWTGTFDGIFHKDIRGANARLADDCRRHGAGLLIPFGSINPKLPDWREEVRRCHEDYKMPGIRLHPNYHSYNLKDAGFLELLKLASSRRLVIQIAASMEDERTQHPLMRVPNVDLSPLPDALKANPQARVVILNSDALRQGDLARRLASEFKVCFDIATVEGVGGVARLAQAISVENVLFGSNYPLYYFESASLKVKEAGFTQQQQSAVTEGNARRLLIA